MDLVFTDTMAQRFNRAHRTDLQARHYFVQREVPNASPYFNLLAAWVQPTPDDRARAEKWATDVFGADT